MTNLYIAQPDITLTLDFDGVIQETKSSEILADEQLEIWCGRRWSDTIDPANIPQIGQMIDDIHSGGSSSYFQVRQKFPSGRELPMEYLAVSLGKSAGWIAIGRNLKTISDLQSSLLLAQQGREKDYWKIREIETRYRLLFDATNEAVLMVRVADLCIVDANLAATRALSLPLGSEFYPDLQPRDRKSLMGMLEKVREHGRAPGIVLHLGLANAPWSLRASLVNGESGYFYLFQITPIGASRTIRGEKESFSIESLIQRIPDGFVVVDHQGIVRRANHCFLDLVQIGAESMIIGQSLSRWLSRPGADFAVLLNLVQRHGSVRMLPTMIAGEFGASTEVEISAAGNKEFDPDYIGLLIRDVMTRLGPGSRAAPPPLPAEPIDIYSSDVSLEQMVKVSTEAIERQQIEAALEIAQGNRTAAAKRLGFSRQSLHSKLKKYKLDIPKR